MKTYYDTEYDVFITEEELRKEYKILFELGETEQPNFTSYEKEVTGKNGTLEIRKETERGIKRLRQIANAVGGYDKIIWNKDQTASVGYTYFDNMYAYERHYVYVYDNNIFIYENIIDE